MSIELPTIVELGLPVGLTRPNFCSFVLTFCISLLQPKGKHSVTCIFVGFGLR